MHKTHEIQMDRGKSRLTEGIFRSHEKIGKSINNLQVKKFCSDEREKQSYLGLTL